VMVDTTVTQPTQTRMEKPAGTEIKQVIGKKSHLLPEVEVKAKVPFRKENEGLRDANIVIDVPALMDERIDKGEFEAADLPILMYYTNPYYANGRYKGRDIITVYNNRFFCWGLPGNDTQGSSVGSTLLRDIETVMISEKPGVSLKYVPTASGNEVVFFIYGSFKGKEPTGIRKTTFEGYSRPKAFFSPTYEKLEYPEKDHRRTLYWNPSVQTDKDGNATVNFYNSSRCERMAIDAETVTEDGAIGVLSK
ncbi:MAG: hypothetical protein Q8914_12105, partial [Bacteroidota bacterium]|nr:hypothetical protein [Bacteroidota bacterium]